MRSAVEFYDDAYFKRQAFSWNPATIGNLAKACGFRVLEAKEIVSPLAAEMARNMGSI